MNKKLEFEKYEPTWESLNRHNPVGDAPEWFKDAKFGIYFHWGPYSVPAFGSEWYAKLMYEKETGNYAHHIAKYGDPHTDWGYEKFILGGYDKQGNWVQFAPKLKSEGGNFDPDEWAAIFKASGAKFAGPAAEHSDGWSNWDSKCNLWNSVRLGPKLDLVRLITDAIEKQGLKTVISMHHQYSVTGEYFTDVPAHTDPERQQLFYQNSWEDKMALYLEKIKEVVDAYKPDILWQDSGVWNIDEDVRLEFLSYYYNRALEWGKEVIATTKGGLTNDCSVQDFERGGPTDLLANYYITDDSISPYTWCYTENCKLYNTYELIHSLMDHISKNGNFLLNVCPMADGTFPEDQKALLYRMGEWLEKNGEAVYSTRAWTVYGEGPTQMGSDHFSDMIAGNADDIRFTRTKDNKTLYATVLGWPESGVTNIKSLSANKVDLTGLESVCLIGVAKGDYIKLDYTQSADALTIKLPESAPVDEEAYVIKLCFNGEIPDPTK